MTDAQDGRAQAAGPGDEPQAGSAATPTPASRAPRPLTPSRPWADPKDDPGTDRAAAPVERAPRHTPPGSAPLAPPRPWARGPEQIASPPLDDPDVPDEAAPGLAPIRPWRTERQGGSLPPLGPRPSNPDVVLQGMTAEVGSERQAETDDERRRRFARQHAAADAARLAALPPPILDELGPPPSSYEPDPAVYDVPGAPDEGPRKRRFGRRRRDTDVEVATVEVATVTPVEDAPVEIAPASYAPDPVVEPETVEPETVEPERAPAPEAARTPDPSPPTRSEPGVLARAVRWLTQRSPEPAEPPVPVAPVAVDVTDAPALDLELADEFHGEPAAPAAEPAEAGAAPAEAPPAVTTGGRHGWRRRRAAKEDEDGPFLPPLDLPPLDQPPLDLPPVASVVDDVPLPAASEVPAVPVSRNRPRPRPRPPVTTDAPTPPSAETLPPAPAQPAPARQRPRPRPAAARAAASPAAETSTEPDPAGPAEAPPADPPAGYRPPDISRFLAATEPQPGDDDREPKEPMRRHRRIRGSRVLRTATRLLIVAGVAIVAAIVLRIYVVAPYYIPSGSMEPTLRGGGGTNDRILVDKITYRIHDPHTGDIVVFDRPDTWKEEPYKTLVKRVIGLPGDIVSLKAGLVYVNGQRLTENYLNKDCGPAPTKPLTRTTRWRVPMDDYFVMGDNRCDSDDSRKYGPIPQSKIVGRAFLIIWPLSRFGTP